MEVQTEMSDDETRDVVDNVKRALQEKVSDESAKPERFIVSHNEEYIHSVYVVVFHTIALSIVIQRM